MEGELLTLIGRIESTGKVVHIHKYSDTTLVGDTALRTDDNVYAKFGALGHSTWRVKVGNGSEWAYGETITEAIKKALGLL